MACDNKTVTEVGPTDPPAGSPSGRVYGTTETVAWLTEVQHDPRYAAVTGFMMKRGYTPRPDLAVAGEAAEAGNPMAAVLIVPFGTPDPYTQGVLRIVRRDGVDTWGAALLHFDQEHNTLTGQHLAVTESGVTIDPSIETFSWRFFWQCIVVSCGYESWRCIFAGPVWWQCVLARCGVYAVLCAIAANI